MIDDVLVIEQNLQHGRFDAIQERGVLALHCGKLPLYFSDHGLIQWDLQPLSA